MAEIIFREASLADTSGMARLRALRWGSVPYWEERIAGYLTGKHHPQEALPPRVIFAAMDSDILAGFVAGHLTRRLDCDGELEWIDILPEYQRRKIAFLLVRRLAAWFIEQKARRICVDVDPANREAREFYAFCGAESLNAHWLVWEDIGKFAGLS